MGDRSGKTLPSLEDLIVGDVDSKKAKALNGLVEYLVDNKDTKPDKKHLEILIAVLLAIFSGLVVTGLVKISNLGERVAALESTHKAVEALAEKQKDEERRLQIHEEALKRTKALK